MLIPLPATTPRTQSLPNNVLERTTFTNETPERYAESEAEEVNFWDTQITEDTPVKPEEPRVYIRSSVFALAGEISIIAGVPKVGKSAVCAPLLATAFMNEKQYNAETSLHIRTTPAAGANVVYIDTEQSPGRTVGFVNKVCRRANLTKCPPNLLFFNWRDYTHTKRYELLKEGFRQLQNVHLIIIDGLTDLVDSVNNENAGNEIINFLMRESSRHNCAVVIIIHENRGGGNARGHVGAESERKCAGMISVKSDPQTEVKEIHSKFLRASGNFAPVLFKWNDEINDYALLSADQLPNDGYTKQGRKEQDLKDLLTKSFGPSSELTAAGLRANLALYKNGENQSETAKRAGKRAFEAANDLGLIQEKDGKILINF